MLFLIPIVIAACWIFDFVVVSAVDHRPPEDMPDQLVRHLAIAHPTRTTPAEAFLRAVEKKDHQAIMRSLKRGLSPNTRNERPRMFGFFTRGETVLMMAAGNEDIETVELLLRAGAAVNRRDAKGRTALNYAARYGLGEYDLNDFVSQGDIGSQYPIVKVVRLLLEAHADPNKADNEGMTPLMLVAGYAQSPECVKLLLKHGARVNAKTKYGWRALDYARRLRERDIPGHENSRVISLLQKAGGRGEAWPVN